jgi:plastocyanin
MIALILPFFLLSSRAEVMGTVSLGNNRVARQAVVSLEGNVKAEPLKKAIVDQRNRSFVPHVLVVTVGTEVQFPNNDTIFHNVFSASEINRFDLGVYPRGKTISRSFSKKGVVALQCKKGVVALQCNIHSEMSAYVVVLDTPYYALTDNQGGFSLPNVPPGRYTLKVWHESGLVAEQLLVVGEISPPALTLSLRRS